MVCLAVRRWTVWPLQMVQKIRGRQQGKGTLGFYELRRGEFSMVVTNWGATILSVRLPDKTGTCNRFVLLLSVVN
jgi:hypothetical protein